MYNLQILLGEKKTNYCNLKNPYALAKTWVTQPSNYQVLAGALYLVFPTAPPTGYWGLKTSVTLETKIKGIKMYKYAMYKKQNIFNAKMTQSHTLFYFKDFLFNIQHRMYTIIFS